MVTSLRNDPDYDPVLLSNMTKLVNSIKAAFPQQIIEEENNNVDISFDGNNDEIAIEGEQKKYD